MERERFRAMFPEEQARGTRVLLVGCGGIGSYAASVLTRLGVGTIRLCDFDKVEEVNVATQDLGQGDVGEYKVLAVARKLTAINPELDIDARRTKFTGDMVEPGWVTVAAVDSIQVRREIYREWVEAARPGDLLVDPRMGAEAFEMWVVRRGSEFEREEYVPYLMDETPRPEPVCGARAIAYTGAFAGAMVGSAVRQGVMMPRWECWVIGDVGGLAMRKMVEVGHEREGLVPAN